MIMANNLEEDCLNKVALVDKDETHRYKVNTLAPLVLSCIFIYP